MGSLPSRKTTSVFDPKLLQVDLVSEITVVKSDERKKKYSNSSLKTNNNQIEHIPKNDPKHFIYFLCEKFDALKELSLDDDLDDGNPIEIRKIDINKNMFPKKSKYAKFTKIKNINEQSNVEKEKKSIHQTSIQFSCEKFINGNFYKIDDLKEKLSYGKNNEFNLNRGRYKSPKNLKIRHHHKKHTKSNKNKDYKNNPSLSTIKEKKTDCIEELNNNEEGQKNVKDSIDLIRSILEEMGN